MLFKTIHNKKSCCLQQNENAISMFKIQRKSCMSKGGNVEFVNVIYLKGVMEALGNLQFRREKKIY